MRCVRRAESLGLQGVLSATIQTHPWTWWEVSQRRWDSNPRHTVLETAALPLSYADTQKARDLIDKELALRG